MQGLDIAWRELITWLVTGMENLAVGERIPVLFHFGEAFSALLPSLAQVAEQLWLPLAPWHVQGWTLAWSTWDRRGVPAMAGGTGGALRSLQPQPSWDSMTF